MHSGESVGGRGSVVLKSAHDFGPDFLGMKAFGIVPRSSGGVGLGIEPKLLTGSVEVSRSVGELVECRVEVPGHVARQRGPQEHPLLVHAFVGTVEGRGGADEHGSG